MKMINKDYIFTKYYYNKNDITLIDNSVYFFCYSEEYRSSNLVNTLRIKCSSTKFVEIKMIDNEKDVIIDIQTNLKYYLRSTKDMQTLINKYNVSIIYIDTTGLNNRIIASLLKNTSIINEKQKLEIYIIYVEPKIYKIPYFKLEGVYNDLSERIEGIEPLPCFANVIPNTDEIKFVALLGFEGGRFTYLRECIQPPEDSIIPIIGVPGYRIEYPFIALWGNRITLEESKSWNDIRYVAANSLIDVYFLLNKILHEPPENSKLILAPIGTKPHAIAAILFAIKYPKQVEIVYDNPKRKINRTDGDGQIIICNISTLLNEN
jgi:hypothetical protein